MAASSGSNRRREWAAQLAWAASGVVLALIVFELLDLRGDEIRRRELIAAAGAGDADRVRELVAEGTPPGVAPGGSFAVAYSVRPAKHLPPMAVVGGTLCGEIASVPMAVRNDAPIKASQVGVEPLPD